MKRRLRIPTLLFAGSLCLSTGAWAGPSVPVASAATAPAPAPDSPQAIHDLHKLLTEAYLKGEQAGQNDPAGIPTAATPIPQASVPAPHHRPMLAAWVEVLRDAITTLSSAFFIAAWGFTIAMLLFGISALLYVLRSPSRKDRLHKTE
jgi:hypothetical protein